MQNTPWGIPGVPAREEKNMSTIELRAENFESTVSENEIVFVDFWASWCGPVPPVRTGLREGVAGPP